LNKIVERVHVKVDENTNQAKSRKNNLEIELDDDNFISALVDKEE
jgi:hypothetical protein